jgi:putative redox protein
MKTDVQIQRPNDQTLSGVLHIPDNQPVLAYALFAHCFTCTKSIKAAIHISEHLSQQGIATLRFDFLGLGRSEGDFADSNFSSGIQDTLSAARFLEENYQAPQLIVGHSFGGTVSLAAAAQISSVKAVATIGAPATPEHILKALSDHLDRLRTEERVVIQLAGRSFEFKQAFVDDVTSYVQDFKSLNAAILVMHSPSDDTVSIDEATKIFVQAKHPKNFVSLDHATHLLSGKGDAAFAADIIASWAKRYLVPLPVEAAPDFEKEIVVEGKTNKAFYTSARVGRHNFVIDEPERVGGTNKGPTPYDYLGAALGGCTSMTLNMYARRKKLSVEKVSVRVVHDRVHAQDCNDCEKTEGKVDRFVRYIEINGDLTDAEHRRMMEIANLCPVHKTFENEIKIETAPMTDYAN